MAARKEILDFIMLERTETPPTHEDVQAHALRITDIYNDRKADLLTLKNDLFELVSECKIYERMGAKHTTPDFEEAIMMLLMTATDWELFLPETEVQRYEKVRLNVIENLADYIRKTYSRHQMQHGTLTPATQTPQVEASQAMPLGTPPPAAGQMGEAGQEPESDTLPQETPLPTDLPSGILPPVLDTLKARRIFGKAIEKGYMEKYTNTNYFRWIGVSDRGRNVQLAYLCGKIYGYYYSEKHHGNVGTQFPEAELKELFDIDNLQQSLFNFYDRPATKRQKWLDSIDALFE